MTVAAVLATIALASYAIVDAFAPSTSAGVARVPVGILVIFFAGAHASPLHLQFGKHNRLVTLTEIPFVLGLLTAHPGPFILARLGGGLIVELAVRRHYRQPVKLLFNSVLFASEAVLGLAVFRWVESGRPSISPWAWAAAVVAAAVVNMVTLIAVSWLIEWVEGHRSVTRVLTGAATGTVQGAAVANIGVVAGLTVRAHEWAVVPLLVAVATFVMAYRAYAAVSERHSRLQHLYEFGRAITGHTQTDAIVAALLTQVRSILLAEDARLVAVDTNGGASKELTVEAGKLNAHPPGWLTDSDGWIMAHVVQRRQPLLIRRGSRDLAAREWLRRNSLREAMFVPVVIDDDDRSVLIIANRLGEIRGYDEDELGLLDTLAKQAAVELRSSRLVRRLRHESLHDATTGIPNRSSLQLAVEARLAVPGGTIALGMIDLDAFKDVNDSFGHHSGDQMLTILAKRLVDAVGDRGDVCRFGGDEFAVALYDMSQAASALCLRGVIEQLSRPIEIEGTAIEVGASIGLAVAPEQANTWAELVRRADVAMYAAKSAGRVVVAYDETLEGSGRSRLGLVAALHRAIDDDELQVYVQPKATLSDSRVVSTEALVRWTHPDLGPMSPAEFIPLAERSGLVRELTSSVLDKAVAACARWQHVAPNVGVAVNISARCLQDDFIEAAVERVLRRHRLPAALLTLEITESSIMADPERTSGLLHRLRRRGVELSIDDFGTGYSSLSYLRRLPVGELKIDRSFVSRMTASADDSAIVQAIVELAHTLDLSVVAEGVEDAATWDLLRQAGVDVAQGYLLAKPMPAADFASWVAAYELEQDRGRYDKGMTIRQLLPGPR
jgi:diguanylate cyclase (GGDEF)-like protein